VAPSHHRAQPAISRTDVKMAAPNLSANAAPANQSGMQDRVMQCTRILCAPATAQHVCGKQSQQWCEAGSRGELITTDPHHCVPPTSDYVVQKRSGAAFPSTSPATVSLRTSPDHLDIPASYFRLSATEQDFSSMIHESPAQHIQVLPAGLPSNIATVRKRPSCADAT
jgi:hypothetical protein